ncbi:hypothetical protein N0V88_000622 [Collariella sp. IMI 366227]|nr:hypothetical protein N0V88_000622 [Collariella sp. IMI 366227]
MDSESYYTTFGGDLDSFAYLSPAISPAAPIKTLFPQPIKTENRRVQTLLPTHQQHTGPSHEYSLYKQQTGLVPGALDDTIALTESSSYLQPFPVFGTPLFDMGNLDDFDFDTSASLADPLIDFGSGSSDMGLSTVDPSAIGGQEPSSPPSPPPLWAQTNNVGRLRPGMHQQAAQQRAEYLEQQQRQLAQAQMQQAQQQARPAQQPQAPLSLQTDIITEQKITQVLNAMRSQPPKIEPVASDAPAQNGTRHKKSEEEMDEDEKLLASEKGKSMDSKTRRQLRNKVSARLFRERRKDYMEDLKYRVHKAEGSNAQLNARNNVLAEENLRLSNLVKFLLSSNEFKPMLNQLSSQPARALSIADPNAREIDKSAMPQLSPSQLPQPLDVPPEQQDQPPLHESINPYALQLQPSPQALQFGSVF